MSFRAKRRDACESIIVLALKSAGASVTQLNEAGCFDLLVGYLGRTYLLECKDAHGKPGRGLKRTETGLRDTQAKWLTSWRGGPTAIVTTADEALRAIGART